MSVMNHWEVLVLFMKSAGTNNEAACNKVVNCAFQTTFKVFHTKQELNFTRIKPHSYWLLERNKRHFLWNFRVTCLACLPKLASEVFIFSDVMNCDTCVVCNAAILSLLKRWQGTSSHFSLVYTFQRVVSKPIANQWY